MYAKWNLFWYVSIVFQPVCSSLSSYFSETQVEPYYPLGKTKTVCLPPKDNKKGYDWVFTVPYLPNLEFDHPAIQRHHINDLILQAIRTVHTAFELRP